jgi:ATP-binding cassette, subfamily B, bacterial
VENPISSKHRNSLDSKESTNPIKKFVSVFRYSGVALDIVWSTSAALTITMALTTLLTGVLPAGIASVGGLFVDAIATALRDTGDSGVAARSDVLFYVFLEAGLCTASKFHLPVNLASTPWQQDQCHDS